MMGNPAFELSGMGFQRLRDDRRSGSDVRGSKSRGGRSGRGQVLKQQSTSSQQQQSPPAEEEESASHHSHVQTKGNSEEKRDSDHSSEHGDTATAPDE